MRQYLENTENRIFLPLVVSTILVSLLILSFVTSGLCVAHSKIVVISVIIWMIWFFLFLMEKRKGAIISHSKGLLTVKLLFALLIALFFTNSFWLSRCFMLDPVGAIVNGKLHIDTLFHSAIAESIKNYGYPCILINDAGFFHYHFGSHFVMAVFSDILNISVFEVYHYIYPVVCFPIYVWLMVSVMVEIRKYKNLTTTLSVIDYLLLACFFIGFLPTIILQNVGIWKSSWIGSESFLFSLIFCLLYILLVLKIIQKSRRKNLSLFLLTLPFIFICTSMKISVGFLLTTGIMYLNFRKNTRKIRSWIANLIFLAVFFISYKIFSDAGGSTEFQLISFVRKNVSKDFFYTGPILHYFYLTFLCLAVIGYQLLSNRPFKNACISKKLIVEETLAVVCIVSLLPGLFIYIAGGGAVYFSYFPELVAICLFIGYNIPDKLQQKLQYQSVKLKNGAICCMILLTVVVLFNSKTISGFVKVVNTPKCAPTALLTNVQEIMKIPKELKKEYCIFLGDNAEIWDLYKSEKPDLKYYNNKERNAIFFYPALTGIRLLNGIYTDGVTIFTSNGAYLQNLETSTYAIHKGLVMNTIDGQTKWVSKLSLEEAQEKAKKERYKYLIYFYNDKYQIIKI